MSGKPKSHNVRDGSSNFLLAVVVFLAMLLLFLRMVVFVIGHGHHQF